MKNKEETMIGDYLQDRFDDEYLGSVVLLGIVVAIIGAFWVVYGSAFNDGVTRFLVLLAMVIIIPTLLRYYLTGKIRKEDGI